MLSVKVLLLIYNVASFKCFLFDPGPGWNIVLQPWSADGNCSCLILVFQVFALMAHSASVCPPFVKQTRDMNIERVFCLEIICHPVYMTSFSSWLSGCWLSKQSNKQQHLVSAACFSMCKKLISLALSVSCLFQHVRRAHQPCTQCQLPVSACAKSSPALHSVSAACFSMCEKLASLALSVSCLFQYVRKARQPCTRCQLPVSACAKSSSALHSVSAACFSMCEELISLALSVSCLFQHVQRSLSAWIM